MKKKMLCWIIIILLIIHIPLFLYMLNFRLTAFNEDYYKSEFKKYKIYDEFPEEDINKINQDLLEYLKNDRTNSLIASDFFTQKEKHKDN